MNTFRRLVKEEIDRCQDDHHRTRLQDGEHAISTFRSRRRLTEAEMAETDLIAMERHYGRE